jgi:hypothetical protein
MSLAADARQAVRARPSLYRALRAGVVNYRAAADALDLDGDPDAVATALRRFADDLEPLSTRAVDATVRMQSGVRLVDGNTDADVRAGDDGGDADADDGVDSGLPTDPDDLVASVGRTRVVRGGDLTAIRVRGDVDAPAGSHVLDRLELAGVVVDAAAVGGDELVVVVPRRQGATALRLVEDALASVPV